MPGFAGLHSARRSSLGVSAGASGSGRAARARPARGGSRPERRAGRILLGSIGVDVRVSGRRDRDGGTWTLGEGAVAPRPLAARVCGSGLSPDGAPFASFSSAALPRASPGRSPAPLPAFVRAHRAGGRAGRPLAASAAAAGPRRAGLLAGAARLALPSILSAALPLAGLFTALPLASEARGAPDVAAVASESLRGGGQVCVLGRPRVGDQVCAPGRLRGGSVLKTFGDVWNRAAKDNLGEGASDGRDPGSAGAAPESPASPSSAASLATPSAALASPHSASSRDPPSSLVPLQSFVRVPIPGDGNCMFRAVAVGLAAAEGRPLPGGREQLRAAQALRDLAADALTAPGATDKHPGATFAIELDEPVASYARRLRRPGFWGGEPELLVLSVELDREIRVYAPEVGGKGRSASTNAPGSGSLAAPANEVVLRLLQTYPGGPEAPTRERIRLLYVGGAHYEALLVPPRAKL